MASKTSIAIAQSEAVERINASLKHMAKERGRKIVQPLSLLGRDPVIVNKNLLLAIADALEDLLDTSKADKATVISDEQTANMSDAETEPVEHVDTPPRPNVAKKGKG